MTRAAKRNRPWWHATAFAAALAAGCTGSIGSRGENEGGGPAGGGSPRGGSGSPGSGGRTGSTAGTSGAGSSAGAGGTSSAPGALGTLGLLRLTNRQLANAYFDLTGYKPDVTKLSSDLSLGGFRSVGAGQTTVGDRDAEQIETFAFEAATAALAGNNLKSFVGCEPKDASDACLKTFIQGFGKRAWRRPLSDSEVTQYLGIVSTVAADSDVRTGLTYAVSGLLQSPPFLYRAELGSTGKTAPAGGQKVPLTSLEMASRLSFVLWDTVPDAELLAAGEKGELETDAGLKKQVTRMLAAKQANDFGLAFLSDLFGLDTLDHLPQDVKTFPALPTGYARSVRGELERRVRAATTSGDFRDLLVGRSTFVDANLARLYGVPAPSGPDADGFAAASLPASGPRAGLFGTAGFLSMTSQASRTSPTKRGKFIRERLLCDTIPPPPPGVNANLDTASDAASTAGKSLRQRLEAHRNKDACRSCHAVMDPLGFGLESFDAIGAYRDKDNGVPVDATGDLDGVAFDSAASLAKAVHDSQKLAPCVATMLTRHVTGRMDGDGERAIVDVIAQAWGTAGYGWKDLVERVILSDAFRSGTAPATEVKP